MHVLEGVQSKTHRAVTFQIEVENVQQDVQKLRVPKALPGFQWWQVARRNQGIEREADEAEGEQS